MAKSLDAAQVASDWATRLASSGDKIKRGVAAVTVAPGASAARQADVWAANVVQAKAKFQRNVGKVGLADWQNAMSTKGVDRIATGASAAQGKMQAFLTSFLPFVMGAAASLPPRGSYEQNKARLIAMIDKTHSYSRQ